MTRERAGEALTRALNTRDQRQGRYANARAQQRAQAAREAEEAARDRELQPRLKADTMARHPEWFR